MNRPFALLAIAISFGAAHAAFAQADGSLELPVDTGSPVATAPKPSPMPSTPAPKSPARAAAAPRTRRSLPQLPSRFSPNLRTAPLRPVGQPAQQTVLARVGTIVVDRAEIRATMGATSAVLSVVTRDVSLAVLKESDSHYGVLMSNTTVGWVPKSAVQLIDYNTEVDLPGQAEPTASSQAPLPAENLSVQEEAILKEAFTYLGVPYVWAGNTRKGLDCSAFVRNVYKSVLGVDLPRHSGDQALVGAPIVSDLRPGDRLYFAMKGSRVSHCGIYIGNNYFIHASTNHNRVDIDQIYDGSHYATKLVSVRR